jgi:quinol-cytochrome oxidoreductase complex cytochrome b subunit
LVVEFAALLIVTAGLTIFSALVRAPLLQLADFNKTPNPSKAPWYFLGLQELLTMFHPMVAGVTIPGMGLFLLVVAPFVDKNPSHNPKERKFAISIFTIFVMLWAVLVIIGSFFRGPDSTSCSPGTTASSSSCRSQRWSLHRHRGGARARRRRDPGDRPTALDHRQAHARDAQARSLGPA